MLPIVLARKALQQGHSNRLTQQVTSLLVASGVGVGIFIGIRAVARNFKKGIRAQQALRPGNPAAIASQLKLAFENDNAFGWGTDEEMLFQSIENIPDKLTFKRVQKAYRDLYGSHLSQDLKNELTSSEYASMLMLINAKFKN